MIEELIRKTLAGFQSPRNRVNTSNKVKLPVDDVLGDLRFNPLEIGSTLQTQERYERGVEGTHEVVSIP